MFTVYGSLCNQLGNSVFLHPLWHSFVLFSTYQLKKMKTLLHYHFGYVPLYIGIGVVLYFTLLLFRRSVRIQDNELRDLAQKIRQANKLREHEDSELSVVNEHYS